jgi:hypothetical protein
VLWIFIGAHLWRAWDLSGVPEQTGMASIVSKSAQSGNFRSAYILGFRVGDRMVATPVLDIEKWTLTNAGDTVPVRYQVGHSGTLYIDGWDLDGRLPARSQVGVNPTSR